MHFRSLFLALVLWSLGHFARGDDLTRSVQEQLHNASFYSGPIDGNKRPELTQAIKRYQAAHKLPPTGTLDSATAEAMDNENGTARQPAPHSSVAARSEQSGPPPATASLTPAASPAEEEGPVLESTANRNPRPAVMAPSSKVNVASPPEPSPTATVPVNVAAEIRGSAPPPANHEVVPPSPTAAANEQDNSVLRSRSNESRVETAPPAAAPVSAGEATQSAPPSGARGIDEQSVDRFIEQYLHSGESNDIPEQTRYFSAAPNYFDHGKVNTAFIRKDTASYIERWPTRRYMLTQPIKVTVTGPDTATAEFTIAFSVENAKRKATGRTAVRATVGNEDGALKIIAIGERRLRE